MPVRGLTDYDYAVIAERLNVEPEALQAVGHVESRDTAFYDDGFPVILFERHKFYKHARRDKRGDWARLYPTICNPQPTPRGGYGTKAVQRVKFSQAFALDPDAAMMACSWGAFQELGENYDDYGFSSVGEFVDMMKSGIAGHLEIFVRSIRKRGLVDELQRKDWAGFARNYNGAGYRRFEYDTQMANAYRVFKNKRVNWNHVLIGGQIKDEEIDELTSNLGSTAIDPAGSPSSPSSNEPANSVETPEPEAVSGSETAAGNGVTEQPPVNEQPPAGDPPDAEPSHWLNVEDWKPWVINKLKWAWSSVPTVGIPGGGALSFAAIKDPDHWHIYAGIFGVLFILVLGFALLTTAILLGILYVNRNEIRHYITESIRTHMDPNQKNLGLKFEKK